MWVNVRIDFLKSKPCDLIYNAVPHLNALPFNDVCFFCRFNSKNTTKCKKRLFSFFCDSSKDRFNAENWRFKLKGEVNREEKKTSESIKL